MLPASRNLEPGKERVKAFRAGALLKQRGGEGKSNVQGIPQAGQWVVRLAQPGLEGSVGHGRDPLGGLYGKGFEKYVWSCSFSGRFEGTAPDGESKEVVLQYRREGQQG